MSSQLRKTLGWLLAIYPLWTFAITAYPILWSLFPRNVVSSVTQVLSTAVFVLAALGMRRLSGSASGSALFLVAILAVMVHTLEQLVVIWLPSSGVIPDWFEGVTMYGYIVALALLALGLIVTRLVPLWIPVCELASVLFGVVFRLPWFGWITGISVKASFGLRLLGISPFILATVLNAVFWIALGVHVLRGNFGVAGSKTEVTDLTFTDG